MTASRASSTTLPRSFIAVIVIIFIADVPESRSKVGYACGESPCLLRTRIFGTNAQAWHM